LYNMSDHLPIRADYVITPKKPAAQSVSEVYKKFDHQVTVQNPFANELNVHVAGALLNKNLNFDLYDINGKRIYTVKHNFTDNDMEFSLPFELKKGVYILKIKNDSGWVIQRKLLKK